MFFKTLYGLIRPSKATVPLFALLALEAEHRMDEFKKQELANTAWAFALTGHSELPLFLALTRAANRCVASFNSHDLAQTA